MNRSCLARVIVCVLLVSLLGGCRSLFKKRESGATSAVPVATAAPVVPAAPVAAAPVVDDGAIPAPQDFEDEAFDKVTAGNYKAELARLKREIEAK
jgi:hypothetical protein